MQPYYRQNTQPIESGPPWRVQPHQAAMRVLHVSFPSPKSHRRLKPLSNSIFRLSLYFLLDFWLTGSDLDSEHRLHTFDAHSRCYCRSTRWRIYFKIWRQILPSTSPVTPNGKIRPAIPCFQPMSMRACVHQFSASLQHAFKPIEMWRSNW